MVVIWNNNRNAWHYFLKNFSGRRIKLPTRNGQEPFTQSTVSSLISILISSLSSSLIFFLFLLVTSSNSFITISCPKKQLRLLSFCNLLSLAIVIRYIG